MPRPTYIPKPRKTSQSQVKSGAVISGSELPCIKREAKRLVLSEEGWATIAKLIVCMKCLYRGTRRRLNLKTLASRTLYKDAVLRV